MNNRAVILLEVIPHGAVGVIAAVIIETMRVAVKAIPHISMQFSLSRAPDKSNVVTTNKLICLSFVQVFPMLCAG